MSVNAIEYFAVLGRKTGPLSPRLCKGIWGDVETVPPAEIWDDAITDIAIVRTGRGESCGSSWELVRMEGGEEDANCNYGAGDPGREPVHIAVMRRKVSQKDSHISNVMVWQAGDPPLPDGFTQLHTSISGSYSGDINVGGTQTYLAVQRSEDVRDALINGSVIIDDISVFTAAKGAEELPDDYLIIDKNINRGLRGEKLFLGYHQRSPMGICDMRYDFSTLDRYPVTDHNGLELPVNELPMFTFPHDLRIRRCSKHDFPLPDFFTFVFTDVHGRHLHAACLQFYENVPLSDASGVFSNTFRKPIEMLVVGDEMEIVCPKVICVLSQMPFYRAMGRFLRQLYSLSLSPMVCPLEHFLTSTVAKVPLPLAGGRPLHIVLDAALISITSKAMAPISLELPSDRFFPPMDLDFAAPLRCMSVENMLTVYCLLLREEKVVFLCQSNALLTEVMETFRSLLFPLVWSSCFITRLPDSLCALLEAPGGLMIGLKVNECTTTRTSSSKEKSVSFVKIGNKNYEKMGGWSSHIPSGSYIVDLSENTILLLETRSGGVLNTSKVGSNIIKVLPSGPKKRIEYKLNRVAVAYGIGPQLSGLERFDSPFEMKGGESMDGAESRNWDNFPTLEIRDAFVVLMADILGNISLYTFPPSKNIDADEYRSFAEEFNIQKYINDADKSCRQLLTQLAETQMFSVLLQTRSVGPNNTALDFFESLSEVLYLTGLSALSSSDRRFETANGHVTQLQLVETPAPLYVLMSHHQRLMHTPSVHRAVRGIHSAGSSILRQFSGKAGGYGNKLLDELMIHVLTPEFRPPVADTAHLELDLNTLREKSRHELQMVQISNAMLQDTTKGPLLLPGPMLDRPNDADDIRYIKYENGWPVLSKDLLCEAAYIHPRLSSISLLKVEEFNNKTRFILAAIPPLEARVSLLSASPLIYPMRQVSTAADQFQNSTCALSMAVDIYSLSITSLSLRAMLQTSPGEQELISQIFEIFGVLATAEGYSLLPYIEECVLRSVLIVCGALPPATYSDYSFFHAACCVVYDTIQNTAGIQHPSSLTFGTYTSALSKFKTLQLKLKKKNASWSPNLVEVNAYDYLQDIGAAWFAAKSVLLYPEFLDAGHRSANDVGDGSIIIYDHATPEKSRDNGHNGTIGTPTNDAKRSPMGGEASDTLQSPRRLWSRFLKKENVNSSCDIEEPKCAMQLGVLSQDIAKDLELCVSCSAQYASVRVRCISSICNDPQCAFYRKIGDCYEYKRPMSKNDCFEEDKVILWGYQEVVAYVCEIRNMYLGKVDSYEGKDNNGDNVSSNLISDSRILNKFTPGKVRVSSMSALKMVKLDPLADVQDIITSFSLHVYSSSSPRRIHTLIFCPSFDDPSLFNAASFASFEVFSQSMADDVLHVEFYKYMTQCDATESKSIMGVASLKISSLPEALDELIINFCHPDMPGETVGHINFIIDQQPIDASDSEDGGSFDEESPRVFDRINGQALNSLLRRNNSDISHYKDKTSIATKDLHSKCTTEISPAANKSWKEKALSIFKGKSSPPASLSSPLVPKKIINGVSAIDERCEDSGIMKVDEIFVDIPTTPFSDLPRPLALECTDETKSASDGIVLVQEKSTLGFEIASSVPEVSDIVPPSTVNDNVFQSNLDLSDLLGAFADNSIPRSLNISNERTRKMSSGSCNSESVNESTVPKRRSLLKPVKRSSVTLIADADENYKMAAAVNSENNSAHTMAVSEVENIDVRDDVETRTTTETESHGLSINTTEIFNAAKCRVVASDVVRRRLRNQNQHAENIRLSVSTGEVVGIFSDGKCPECGFLHFDEEFMAQWATASHSMQSLSKTNSLVQNMRPELLRMAHKVKCVHCAAAIHPTLTVKCYALSTESTSELIEKWDQIVIYLSPFCLRLVYEQLVSLHGAAVLDPTFMVKEYSHVFWGLRWYSKKLLCPVGLTIADVREMRSIVCSRQEAVLRARVLGMLLSSSKKNKLPGSIMETTAKMVALYFPGIDVECISILADAAINDLNGTVAGMRRAIIKIYPHVDRIMPRESKVNLYTAKARNLYTCALTLCHTTIAGEKFLQCPSDMPFRMQKGNFFDIIYSQTIAGGMSNRDMIDLGATQMELISGIDGALAKSIRVVLGFWP